MGYNIKPFKGIQLNHSHRLSRNLVGCWLLNEGIGFNINDLSGNGNNGSLNLSSSGEWQPGKTGYTLSFVSDDYVVMENSANSSLDIGMESISIVGLVKTNYSNNDVVFQKSEDLAVPGSPGYSLYLRTTNPYVRMVVQDGSEFAHLGSQPQDIRDGEWHQIIGMWNYDTQTVSVYVDTVLKGSTVSADVDSLSNISNFEIGRNFGDGSPDSYYDGAFEYLYVYKEAINQIKINELYYNPYAMFEAQSPGRFISIPGAPPAGIVVPIISSDGIHSVIFGGQVITG